LAADSFPISSLLILRFEDVKKAITFDFHYKYLYYLKCTQTFRENCWHERRITISSGNGKIFKALAKLRELFFFIAPWKTAKTWWQYAFVLAVLSSLIVFIWMEFVGQTRQPQTASWTLYVWVLINYIYVTNTLYNRLSVVCHPFAPV